MHVFAFYLHLRTLFFPGDLTNDEQDCLKSTCVLHTDFLTFSDSRTAKAVVTE